MAAPKKEVKRYTLPEGRVINASLFEKDIYVNEQGQEGKPSYKLEIAFDENVVGGEGQFDDDIANFAADTWGDAYFDKYLNGEVVSPLLDGNKLAARREEKGKTGDAYKGKLVLRTNTTYNWQGADAPGGVYVCGPDAKQITPAEAHQLYNGCYGIAVVTLKEYIDNRGEKAITTYLVGFQKTRDGDRLSTHDASTLFKPVGGTVAEGGRRTRRG